MRCRVRCRVMLPSACAVSRSRHQVTPTKMKGSSRQKLVKE